MSQHKFKYNSVSATETQLPTTKVRFRQLAKTFKVTSVALALGFSAGVCNADATPPQNPYLSANGGATMHGDASSSDVSPYAGPAENPNKNITNKRLAQPAACPTVLFGSDSMPIALCTKIFGRSPVIYLFDPDTDKTLASLDMTKGSLLGGVYAYMDNENRLVMVDGNDDLVRVSHEKDSNSWWDDMFNSWSWYGEPSKKAGGEWKLEIDEKVSIKDIVRDHCGGIAGCDSVVGLVPDWQGNVFVATKGGVVGVINPETKQKSYIKLGEGERIDNSISSAPEGVAVTTSHATYLIEVNAEGNPEIIWKQEYDRGTARKPGQLSWGSGATPSFFGPQTGSEYLTITDNADAQVSALVYDTATGAEICKHPVFDLYLGGTENSAIAYGNSMYIANTFGYPYPKYPDGAGISVPESAPFYGGMERVDILENADGSKYCETIWENTTVRSSAVPRLSSVDGYIYTTERKGIVQPGYHFYSTVIDSETGQVVREDKIGYGFIFDTLEMVGTIMPNGTWYQGILSGVVKSS